MITVFGGWPSRSLRVIWALEELGLEYTVRPVDLRRRNEDEAFITLNPGGFLPVLQDGDVAMVESIAILEYLIARYGQGRLAPAPADPEFPLYQQFLHLGEAGLAAYLNIVVASKFFAPEAERRNWGVQVAEQMFFSRLKLVSQRLAVSPMMAGDEFTAADISVMYALELAERLGLSDRFEPELMAYRERLSSRPAYRKADEKSRAPLPTAAA